MTKITQNIGKAQLLATQKELVSLVNDLINSKDKEQIDRTLEYLKRRIRCANAKNKTNNTKLLGRYTNAF